jgi:hypothetical protein
MVAINPFKKAFDAEVKKQVDLKANVLTEKLRDATFTPDASDQWHYENGKIVNNAKYIVELNNGNSATHPSHFIERTLLSDEDVKPNGAIIALN